jgi:hypothetical protein
VRFQKLFERLRKNEIPGFATSIRQVDGCQLAAGDQPADFRGGGAENGSYLPRSVCSRVL